MNYRTKKTLRKIKLIMRTCIQDYDLVIRILLLLFLIPFKKCISRKKNSTNKISSVVFLQFATRGGITGGDNVVNSCIKKIVEENGIPFEFVNFDTPKAHNKTFFSWLFGEAWYINKTLKKKIRGFESPLIISDSQLAIVDFGCRTVCVSHYSFLGYFLLAQRKNVTSFLKMCYKSLLQKYGAIGKDTVAVSDFQKKYLQQEGVKVSRVIRNPMSVVHDMPKGRLRDFIFLGRYDPYGKGFDILEKLAERGWHIDCYTNGSVKGSKLCFKEPISHEQVLTTISQYKILLHPSRFETCGMTVLEALSCGTPVIMAPVGLGDHLRNIVPEFVVSAGNNCLEEYERKYSVIMQNYEHYSTVARRYVENFHSLEVFSSDWKETLSL